MLPQQWNFSSFSSIANKTCSKILFLIDHQNIKIVKIKIEKDSDWEWFMLPKNYQLFEDILLFLDINNIKYDKLIFSKIVNKTWIANHRNIGLATPRVTYGLKYKLQYPNFIYNRINEFIADNYKKYRATFNKENYQKDIAEIADNDNHDI